MQFALPTFLGTLYVPLPLVKEIGFGGAEIDDLGTTLPVLAQLDAFAAVVGVGDAGVATDHAPTRQAAVIALVADVHDLVGIDHAGTHHAQSVTC